MKKRIAAFLILNLIVVTTMSFRQPKRIPTIWMIGDSTMCIYESTRAPITGWGMPFTTFFRKELNFQNRAKGGRSTRTFITEGRWKPIADSLVAGDYVFMHFGHNDEAKEEKYRDRYTSVTDYKINLSKFITEARQKSALPIVITPVSRMKFDSEGIALETHKEYTKAACEVAEQLKVPLIDLDKASRALFTQLGPERTKMLFMQIAPDVNPVYPEGQKDNTHFNELGARMIAELVLHEIQVQHLELTDYLYKPKK